MSKEVEPTAEPSDDPSVDHQLMKFVFYDGDLGFAVAPSSVVEVIGRLETTQVPFTPAWVDGVVTVRGEVVPVLDLSVYFGLPRTAPVRRDRLIVIGSDGHTFSVWSDRIVGVEAIDPRQLETPMANLPEALLRCCQGQIRLKDNIVYVLDLRILRDESRQRISAG